MQQLSPQAPQLVIPGPPGWQLGGPEPESLPLEPQPELPLKPELLPDPLPELLPLELLPEPDAELPPLDPLLPEDPPLLDVLPLLFAAELLPVPELLPPPLPVLDTPAVASSPLVSGGALNTSRALRPPQPRASTRSTVEGSMLGFIAPLDPLVPESVALGKTEHHDVAADRPGARWAPPQRVRGARPHAASASRPCACASTNVNGITACSFSSACQACVASADACGNQHCGTCSGAVGTGTGGGGGDFCSQLSTCCARISDPLNQTSCSQVVTSGDATTCQTTLLYRFRAMGHAPRPSRR